MISAVLDTNVLVSGILRTGRSGRPPAELIRHWRLASFELVCSEPIIEEVARALAKPYFRRRISPARSSRVVRLIVAHSRMVKPSADIAGVATHPEDDLIVATAVAGAAAYLVTGDVPLLTLGSYRQVTIVSPRVFLDMLSEP